MKIENVHLITFSPTHTSKRVGEAIVRGLGIENSKKVDLTFQALDEYEIPTTDLALISVPVYGGKVAPLALQRLEGIRSNGAPVVLVVVYGNRAYEKALQQLDAFVTERGFKVISGGTFIGEHSYSTPSNPIAVGRPDADDLQFAEEYGQKLLFKIEQAADLEHLYGVDVLRIQRPSQPIFPMLRFIWQLSQWRKQGVVMPRTPQVDANFRWTTDKHIAYLDADKLTAPLHLRKWQAGDWFIPLGMKGKKLVSNYLTDRKYSLWQKEQQYVLCCNNDIVWLVGERIDQRYCITEETKKALVVNFEL